MAKKNKSSFWTIMYIFFIFMIAGFFILYLTQRLQGAPATKLGKQTIMIMENENDKLGNILVNKQGLTLYTFKNDSNGKSNCYQACATNWPPLMVEPNAALGLGLQGVLGSIQRSDGTVQATYNGQPLYTYSKDKKMGDTLGQGINKLWYVVKP